MNKVLEVQNITKTYKMYKNNSDRLKEVFFKKSYHKEFTVNKDITFDLFEGETLGIIGVNGAGKSTILKIIAGVIEPTHGTVTRHGRVTALLELGTGFNDEVNGYENISLNGMLIGMEKQEIDSKIEQIIAFSELGEYIYEPIKTYSSGMKMRLAFSIAIFSEPKVLIVDEALSVGDAHFQQKCTTAMKERKKKNMSIIYVSHDLNSLKVLCNRTILLNAGEIVEEGNPESVINKYNFLISKLNEDENCLITNEYNDSYGSFDIKILNVKIKGEKSNSKVISSGEESIIEILLDSKKELKDITIGIMIKDRFGQDIFGTNTYYKNIKLDVQKDSKYKCLFKMPLNIGIGKYSITAALHSQDNHIDDCYHWLDFAEDFEIAGTQGDLFVGLCKLEPSIEFIKID